MNTSEEQSNSEEPSQPVNLNDLQNYLVTFNKEIEPTEHPEPHNDTTTTNDEGGDSSGVIFPDVPDTHDQLVFQKKDLTTVPDREDVSLNAESNEISSDSITIESISSVQTSEHNTASIEQDTNQSASRLEDMDSETSLSDVHSEIAQLTASGQTQMQTVEGMQLLAEGQVQAKLVPVSGAESVSIEGLPTGAQHSRILQVQVPVSGDSSQNQQKIVHVVSLDSHDQMQLVDPVTGALGQDGELMHLTETSSSVTDPTNTLQVAADSGVIDGTDPVAVLASVAANTSNVSQIQSVQVGQTELNAAQLVALQNSADSSQPQLVAVQSGDPGSETIQVIGSSEAGQTSNPIVLSGAGSQYQTVTIMPSEVAPNGEMNYVLIVTQPEGDKDDGDLPKQIAIDMGSLDFAKDTEREIVEELIEEDGTTKKVLRITNKKYLMGIPGSPNSQMMCNYCDYTSPKRYLLTRHMKSHSEDRPHKCNICGRGFKTMASLQNHVNTHSGIRPHKCKQCEAAFTTSGELVRHIRYKHTFEKPHKCTECDYASVELSKLKRHMRSHTGERPYQCPHCHYASPDTYKLKRHMRIHTGEKPYECDVCHAKFTQSNSLKAHKLIHSGNKPVFQCDLCPTTCGRKTDLKIHMQKLHTSEKPLVCRKCDKTLPDRYTYKMHIKSHDGEKCFKCDHCDYAALSQRHLESHSLTHTGEKPFECDECEQTFRQKQLLKRHKNLYHTPDYSPPEPRDKMYDCTECDKSFAHKGNLLRHMHMHDPDNPLYKGLDDSPTRRRSLENMGAPLTAEQLLQGSLLNEMKEGKLGSTPKVVIVHPDGRVEEVTSKLQSMVQEKTMEDMLLAAVGEAEGDGSLQEQEMDQQQMSATTAQAISVQAQETSNNNIIQATPVSITRVTAVGGAIMPLQENRTVQGGSIIPVEAAKIHGRAIIPIEDSKTVQSIIAASHMMNSSNGNTIKIGGSFGSHNVIQQGNAISLLSGNQVQTLNRQADNILVIPEERKDVETQAAIESGDEGDMEVKPEYQIIQVTDSTDNADDVPNENLHIDLSSSSRNETDTLDQISRKRKESESEIIHVEVVKRPCLDDSQ